MLLLLPYALHNGGVPRQNIAHLRIICRSSQSLLMAVNPNL
jgi:hypothetical protein